MKRFSPRRCSTGGPKKYRASMLKKMCPIPPCANMYVMIVHGWTSTCDGSNKSRDVTPGEKYCRAKTRTFAMSRRWTQGVTDCSPSTRSGHRALERFEGSCLLFPGREREVELRTHRLETGPEAMRFFYSTRT